MDNQRWHGTVRGPRTLSEGGGMTLRLEYDPDVTASVGPASANDDPFTASRNTRSWSATSTR